MAGLRVDELESLKKLDVSSWSEKIKENHARNIEILTARVVANTTKLKKKYFEAQQICGSGTGSGNSDRGVSSTNE